MTLDVTDALDASLRPPLVNGEVVFEEPWQGRVFGMAVALRDAGVFDWSEFQDALIEVVGAWDRSHDVNEPYHYYRHFAHALQNVLRAKGFLTDGELTKRAREFASRPHGHDH
jgi:nitrile hydratase accessory protein